MDSIRVRYQIRAREEDLVKLVHGIALEQTLEVPEELVRRHGLEHALGRVEEILPRAIGPDLHRATIAFDATRSTHQIPQLLNLLNGNISFQDGVRIERVELPESLLAKFPGPRHGIPGVRARLGVFRRPLLATALKPRGLPVDELARLAHEFACGGGDLVKDDHNIVDATPREFRERVLRIHEAVRRANDRTGRTTLYLPNLCMPAEEIDPAIEFLLGEGVEGVMLAPMLIGLDQTRRLREEYGLILLSHPAFSGGAYVSPFHGMAHGILLGTLYRLAGIDISVFVNFGGRFAFTREQCVEIGERLREPLGGLLSAFPAPAGGMRFENLGEMGKDFGEDAVFLVGGALFAWSDDVRASTATFRRRIEESFPACHEVPRTAAWQRLPTGL